MDLTVDSKEFGNPCETGKAELGKKPGSDEKFFSTEMRQPPGYHLRMPCAHDEAEFYHIHHLKKAHSSQPDHDKAEAFEQE